MTYKEKLLDPRWQRKRLEILGRDDFTCRRCGDKTKTLHVHHIFYERGKEPWECVDTALITLCEECHELETIYYQQAMDHLLQALREKQYIADNIECLAIDIESGTYKLRDMAYLQGKK